MRLRETPETDSNLLKSVNFDVLSAGLVTADFARRLERERDAAWEQLRLANIDSFAALTELDAAQKYADAAMFERDQLRMRVAELENGIVVEGAK